MPLKVSPVAICSRCLKAWSKCKGTCSRTREELLVEQLKTLLRHYKEGMIDHESVVQGTWDAVWCGKNHVEI